MPIYRIHTGSQYEKLIVVLTKQLKKEPLVAFYLKELSSGFKSGKLNEDLCENANATHFVYFMNDEKMLAFIKDKELKSADVVSGGKPNAMMVRLLVINLQWFEHLWWFLKSE